MLPIAINSDEELHIVLCLFNIFSSSKNIEFGNNLASLQFSPPLRPGFYGLPKSWRQMKFEN